MTQRGQCSIKLQFTKIEQYHRLISMKSLAFTPRFIRLRDAPAYLGFDRNRFNREVRPYIPEIKVGIQGIAFDRLDLDAFADQYKERNGRPAQTTGISLWDVNARQVSTFEQALGTLTNT